MSAQDVVTIEEINNLTLGDEYLFETVMQNKELCKKFISTFLEIPNVVDIEYISAEEAYQHSYSSKGVRFDVFVQGVDGIAYVIELQQTNTYEIEKRLRFYSSMVDSRQLSKGQKNKYKDLKDNYIIFIARESIFKGGLYRYTFKNVCLEMPDLILNDGSTKIVFDTKGTHGDVSEDVLAFLRAIEGEVSSNEFVKEFQDMAEEIKTDEIWRSAYMQSLLREQDKWDEAQEEKAIEVAKKLLKRGLSPIDIAEDSGLSFEVIEQLQQENR